MITEPPTDGQRTPLQEFETLYIGGAEPVAVRRAYVAMNWQYQDLAESGLGRIKTLPDQDLAKSRFGQIKTMRDCEGKFNDQDGSYRLGDGSNGNKHEVER
jgi:hypothetical protein